MHPNNGCHILRLGRNNPTHQYRLGSRSPETDLGVLGNKYTMSQQCALAVKEANSLRGCIRQSSVERGDFCPLLSTGQTLLEGWVQCYISEHKTDLLGFVQQRATKMMKGLGASGSVQPGKGNLKGILPTCLNT